jgi:membrane dipeptidase
MINTIEMGLYSKIVDGIDTVDVDGVIDHISHIVDIGGIDCVGLGSDFDGIPCTPSGLSDISCYPTLITGLMKRGFTDHDIRQITGMNLFHFLQQFDH